MKRKKKLFVMGPKLSFFLMLWLLGFSLFLTGCGKQFARIEENQQALQSMIKDNAEWIAAISSNMQLNQDALQIQVDTIRNETLAVGTNVNYVGNRQKQFYEQTQNNYQLTTEKTIAAIEENMNRLKAEMEEMQNGIIQVAANLSDVSQVQARLYETMRNQNQELNQKITALNHQQSDLQAGIENAINETVKVAADIVTLGDEQKNLHITTQKNIRQVAENVTVVENYQSKLQADIQKVQGRTNEVAVSLANADQKHMELSEIVHNNNLLLNETIASAKQNQKELRAEIVNLQNETSQAAANISAVNNEQKNLQELVQNNNQQLIDKVIEVEQNQQQWQETFYQIQERIQEVTANISVLGNNLSELHNILQSNISDLQIAANTANQEQQQFQEKVQSELLALADTISIIKQSNVDLQKQIEDVRLSTDGINTYMPAVIEEFGEDIIINNDEENNKITTE